MKDKLLNPSRTETESCDPKNPKDTFVRNVEHELRTPLSIIQGYAKLLYNQELGPLEPEQSRALSRILGQTDRMCTLVERMGVLLSVEGGTGVSIPVSLRGMLAELVRDQREAAAGACVTFEVRLEPDLPLVAGDPYHLRHALVYLIESAIRSTPRGGRVWIQSYVEADRIYVAVGDTGAGILAGRLAEFLTDGDQMDSQQAEASLGLALVTVVVKAHGGRIERQSQPGLGSHITLSLPILSHTVGDLDRSTPVLARQEKHYVYASHGYTPKVWGDLTSPLQAKPKRGLVAGTARNG